MGARSEKVRWGFSLAEMLVVIGVLALLVALMLPPLEHARQQALVAQCGSNLKQLGLALEMVRGEHRFYPQWDDRGDPYWTAGSSNGSSGYTWVDLLVQHRAMSNNRVGICPADAGPDPLMEARLRATGLRMPYPGKPDRRGMYTSYGLGLPLSAGGWAWNEGTVNAPDGLKHFFDDHEMHASRRVLAGDGSWTALFNLSGSAVETGVWNEGSQFDNTVSWRHPNHSANLLYQDQHVSRVQYQPGKEEPVDTVQSFVWYPGEPRDMTFSHEDPAGHAYPHVSPPSPVSVPPGDTVPAAVIPKYYTDNSLWDHPPPIE